MSTTDEYGSSYGEPYGEPVTGWVGWIIFAAVFMVTIGAINVFQGLAALFRDDAYWETFRGDIVTFNITTWGWISLIFGVLLIIVGLLLMQGSTFARVLAIALVSLNLLSQFGWASFYPFWGMIVIAIDIVIIYALVVHGGELKRV
jgi:vacuolar-type H+-ATPase subunit I/STV1